MSLKHRFALKWTKNNNSKLSLRLLWDLNVLLYAKIWFSAWHHSTKVSNCCFITWAPPNIKIQMFCTIFCRASLCKCPCASGSLIFTTDSQRSLWNWFLLSCSFDFHTLMSVLHTNLWRKQSLSVKTNPFIMKESVSSQAHAGQKLFNVTPSKLLRKATQKRARHDFTQYEKWNRVLKSDLLKVKVKCKI